jgi:hypothetical protein
LLAAPAYGAKVTAFPRPPESVRRSSTERTSEYLNLSAGEKVRLVGWLVALACAVVGWNVFLWRGDASAPTPGWLLPAIIGTLPALGLLGGALVPRREASWLALFTECGAGAAAVGGANGVSWFVINELEGQPDELFPLFLGTLLLTAVTLLVLGVTFLCAYGLRTVVIRAARLAFGSAPRA